MGWLSQALPYLEIFYFAKPAIFNNLFVCAQELDWHNQITKLFIIHEILDQWEDHLSLPDWRVLIKSIHAWLPLVQNLKIICSIVWLSMELETSPMAIISLCYQFYGQVQIFYLISF